MSRISAILYSGSHCMPPRRFGCCVLMIACLAGGSVQADDATTETRVDTVTGRRPQSQAELRYWLNNALVEHQLSFEETALALDMTELEVREAMIAYILESDSELNLNLDSDLRRVIEAIPAMPDLGPIRVLPYPGGRHPRIGFLDGAIDPQRETKVSVFTPWQPESERRADYVVVDVPEAIWSNLGLTYLAHTHVPTIWTMQNIELEPLEWDRSVAGQLSIERELPNGISFTSEVTAHADHVSMVMTLTNGTDETLTDLRVQNCVMLKAAEGFNQQTNDNKVFRDEFVAVHDESGERWIITAWLPLHRAWGNAPCPCLHSDPKFPDCTPGETQTIRGWLSFYEGTDIDAELDRIEQMQWWEAE